MKTRDPRPYGSGSQTLIRFEGVLSRARLEELGRILRDKLATDTVHAHLHDVFPIYIEMAQNIRHYAAEQGYADHDTLASISVTLHTDGRYVVRSANSVDRRDGLRLAARVAQLAALDAARLKLAYHAQLRQRHVPGRRQRAGLGLIDVARRASGPLHATLTERLNGRACFCLSVTI